LYRVGDGSVQFDGRRLARLLGWCVVEAEFGCGGG